MLTSRGWWLLLLILTLLAVGMVLILEPSISRRLERRNLLLLGLGLALWFAWEWGRFSIQARLAVRNLVLTRELRDDRGPVTTLWTGQTFTVRGRARLGGSLSIDHVLLSDRPPAAAGPVEGELRFSGPLAAGTEVAWEYHVHCPAPGSLRFEGARVQLADPQGFFYFETFLRRPIVFAVLPKLVDADARQRATKRFNLLPPPGIHRLRRPGSGSELLDLRDYRPGDPPKRIAWKVSARRDKLITRELESEVPIRCTLFVDASDAVRLGPPGENALAGLTDIAATVAQAAAGNRDLVGMAVCDDSASDYVAPARSSSHTVGLLRRLARVANLAPATEAAVVGPLVDRAYALATEVYPDLLRPELNRFPAWLPFFSPQPGYNMRGRWLREVWLRTMQTLAIACLAAGTVIAVSGFGAAGGQVAAVTLLLGLLVGAAGYFIWLPWGLFTRGRRRYAWRKKLAAILAVIHRHPPGALALFLEDDVACARELQRFLADHQVPYDVPLYDARGRYLFAPPAKVDVLAKALLRAVSRGHDNELYVLLADLLELEENLGPLLKAVRVARSRHHTVLVVCPWPAGLPPLAGGGRSAAGSEAKTLLRMPSVGGPLPPAASAADIVRRMAHARADRAWRAIRRAFGRMRVPVLNASSGDPARLILLRLEQMRRPRSQPRMSQREQIPDDVPPLAHAYLLAGFAALVVFGLVLVNTAGQLAMVPTLIGAAGLAFRWRTGPLLFLVSVAIGELYLNWYRFGPRISETTSLLHGLGFCGAGLVYVVAQYRLLGLTVGIFPPDPRPGDPPPPRTNPGGTKELIAALVTAVAVTAAAFMLWTASEKAPAPWQSNDQRWPLHWQLGLLAWVLLGGLAVATALIGHLGWRRLSRTEAAVFLQDGLWHETRREQRRINRWRAWACAGGDG